MRHDSKHRGVALLLTVFVVALLSAMVIGLLRLNEVEIQVMGNQIYAAEALATAQAGLNDAFAQIRADATWADGFTNKAFNGGSYTVLMTTTDPSTDPVSPTTTDYELDAEALGAISPGVTQDFAVHHPDLDDDDFDSRADITINAGSYYFNGVMSGNPFTLSIPLDATSVSFQITLKKLDYPELSANVNCAVSWDLETEGSTSAYPTIISEGTSARGFVARVVTDITIVGTTSPHSIYITEMRVNE